MFGLPLRGMVCAGSSSSEVAVMFLVPFYLLSRICPNCTPMPLFFVLIAF